MFAEGGEREFCESTLSHDTFPCGSGRAKERKKVLSTMLGRDKSIETAERNETRMAEESCAIIMLGLTVVVLLESWV